MIIVKKQLKVIIKTLIFVIIGWILMVPLNLFFMKSDLKSWTYLIIEILYMSLAGMVICYVVNRKNLSLKLKSFKKSSRYYRLLATQFLTWLVLFIVASINELTKSQFVPNLLRSLSGVVYPDNPYSLFAIFIAVGFFYILPFLFITVMGLSYIVVQYLFDKSTLD